MAAQIEEEFGLAVKLTPGGIGAFEVSADGKLLFSKQRAGRFPEAEEVLALLRG